MRRPIVVLLVDDQRFIGAAVGQLLAAETDIELHFCERSVDALALANQVDPTVILQDLIMPGVDGLTLLLLYRENPQTSATPVIMLSGNDDEASRERALAAGAADYLVKLPPKADLIACIRRHAADAPKLATPQPFDDDATVDDRVIAVFHDLGSPDFTRGLIDQYLLEAGSRVQTLGAAAVRGDHLALMANAHSLKGSSLVMGAQRLAALCGKVEGRPASGPDDPVIAALMKDIEEELVRVRRELAIQRPETLQS